jgi:hypothetical protein
MLRTLKARRRILEDARVLVADPPAAGAGDGGHALA